MTSAQGNTSGTSVDTHLLSVQQYKDNLPLLLDGQGREKHHLKEIVRLIADRADYTTGRNAWPSVDWLAEHARITRRAVFRLLKQAEESKLVIRDGKGPKGVTSWRLNLELDVEMAWLPTVAAREHRRERSRKTTQRWRERKQAGGDSCPVTEERGVTAALSPSSAGDRPTVTQPVLVNHHEENLPPLTAVAAAPTVSLDVIDAKIVDEPGTALALTDAGLPAVADLSASWLLPEPEQTGKRRRSAPVDAPRYDAEAWTLPREQHTPSEWVGKLTALYVDRCRECGFEPADRQKNQVGKEVKALVAAGNNPVHVLAAVKRAAEKRGAWVMRAMADVQPGNWAARPGRQIVTTQGVVQLPEGMSAGDRRAAALSMWE